MGCERLLLLRIGATVAGESDKRRDGVEAFCRGAGVEHDTLYLCDSDGYGPFWDFLQGHIHQGHLDYDGIFCCTDVLTQEIRKMLTELGVHVPQDVQLIGFDGTAIHMGRTPECSTIVQPVPLLAETCVDILLKEDKSDLPSLICLPVSYAPGGTTQDQG